MLNMEGSIQGRRMRTHPDRGGVFLASGKNASSGARILRREVDRLALSRPIPRCGEHEANRLPQETPDDCELRMAGRPCRAYRLMANTGREPVLQRRATRRRVPERSRSPSTAPGYQPTAHATRRQSQV